MFSHLLWFLRFLSFFKFYFYLFFAFVHEGVGEARTRESILNPTTYSICHSKSSLTNKEGIFTGVWILANFKCPWNNFDFRSIINIFNFKIFLRESIIYLWLNLFKFVWISFLDTIVWELYDCSQVHIRMRSIGFLSFRREAF